MKKRISLIFPQWHSSFKGYSEAAKKVSTFPPLNLALVGALAEREGWEVQLLDAHICGYSKEDIVRLVRGFDPGLVGLTATTPYWSGLIELGGEIKARLGLPVLAGGTHATVCGAEALHESLDYVWAGECERGFPDFLRALEAGEKHPKIPGLVFEGSEVSRADFLMDLDEAPPPARHLLPNDRYEMGTKRGWVRYTSLQMTRGCPFSCVFCACDLHGKRYRRRRLDNVMAEIETAVGTYGASHIYFVDDTLTLDRGYILALCNEIEKRKLKITFEGSTRANLWDAELVRRLKDVGLIRISFGLESADPRIRELIKKNVPLDDYAVANRLSNRLGIETINSAMIGLPGETRESIRKTVAFIRDSRDLLHTTLNIAIPYPGTELYRWAKEEKHGLRLLTDDYSKYVRYGSAVMEVNGISPDELVRIQKLALIEIYSRWWRWMPTIRRFGLKTIVKTLLGMVFSPAR